ncbi:MULTISPECIES: hypothetical protein [Ramlibacter]|uniref:Uncharacterized protein n=1 Tax=Ramlibacter pinisoli TaxID=2682844 RepID=A0A6N8IMC8_9BURK|nr:MULTISPECIES: hypothetical protein [Ramlibacter]MBA2960520.1 hypothetical protein [Ramlibacter sp. CGMCC 1.13660]MVQ27852.1 hypothetical protein [Ramlibacter pinisoli]
MHFVSRSHDGTIGHGAGQLRETCAVVVTPEFTRDDEIRQTELFFPDDHAPVSVISVATGRIFFHLVFNPGCEAVRTHLWEGAFREGMPLVLCDLRKIAAYELPLSSRELAAWKPSLGVDYPRDQWKNRVRAMEDQIISTALMRLRSPTGIVEHRIVEMSADPSAHAKGLMRLDWTWHSRGTGRQLRIGVLV